MVRSRQQFIQEQGLAPQPSDAALYQALMFQPRAVGVLLTAGAALQSASFFAGLAVVMWWSALVPAHNPFDAVYNAVVARRVGVTKLASGAVPRRLSAGLAGTVALAIAAALTADQRAAAWLLEAFFAIAVVGVVAARFCPGAALYRIVSAIAAAQVFRPASRHR